MKVALWAEIRRLSEIEKLSGWAIARRHRPGAATLSPRAIRRRIWPIEVGKKRHRQASERALGGIGRY